MVARKKRHVYLKRTQRLRYLCTQLDGTEFKRDISQCDSCNLGKDLLLDKFRKSDIGRGSYSQMPGAIFLIEN